MSHCARTALQLNLGPCANHQVDGTAPFRLYGNSLIGNLHHHTLNLHRLGLLGVYAEGNPVLGIELDPHPRSEPKIDQCTHRVVL